MNRRPLIAGALVITAANLIDYLTTTALVHRGWHELNPLAEIFLAAGILLAIKMAIAGALTARLQAAGRRTHPTALLATTWAVAGAYLAIALGNTLALLR